MRILAIDPGEKNLGIAISDPSGTIANPLGIIKHVSRRADAQSIIQIAVEKGAELILVGQPLDVDGKIGYQGRKSIRLAGALKAQSDIPIILWDESSSTVKAREAQFAMGTSRQKRKGHLDDLAAVIILQTYLDSQAE